jgi:hypothetical protein
LLVNVRMNRIKTLTHCAEVGVLSKSLRAVQIHETLNANATKYLKGIIGGCHHHDASN